MAKHLEVIMKLLTCAAAVALWPACAGDADEGDQGDGDGEATIESEVTGCAYAQAAGGFGNQAFAAQSNTFSAEVVATPSGTPIDAVIGLSDGAASDYTRLAAVVRFNPTGTIDARSGGVYRADASVRYVAGQPYRFRFDVNVRGHIYSVSLLQAGSTIRLATNYPFRTEQASVTRLSNLATAVASSTGFVQACGFSVAPVVLPCKTASAGATFTNTTLTRSSGVLNLDVSAVPSAARVDEVIGLSLGAATSYTSLAASVRFGPNGLIEVRDGDTYRSNYPITYAAGYSYQFHFTIDVVRHEYSVWVKRPTESYPLDLGLRQKFRPTQSSVAALDNLATIVASSFGTLRTCNAQSRASSRTAYAIDQVHEKALPLPNNELLVRDFTPASNGDAMLRLSATGQPLARIPVGGTPAVDAAGNVYIARGESPGLTLHSYSPTYAFRWSRSLALSGDLRVHSIGTDTAGNVMIAMQPSFAPYNVLSVHSFTSTGSLRWSINANNAANIAFARDGFALAWTNDGSGVIRRQDSSSRVLWEHAYSYARPGRVTVNAMSVDDSGRVFFAGKYAQSTNFSFTSGVPLLVYQPGTYDTNSYLVGLSSTGAFMFQRRLGVTDLSSLAANATGAVVSGTNKVGANYPQLIQFDNASGRIISQTFDSSFGPNGDGGRAVMNGSGRIFWYVYTRWGGWQVALQP